jgi:hypothetical protein
MLVSGIAEIRDVKFKPKNNPKKPDEKILDYALVTVVTYDTTVEGSIKKDSKNNEIISQFPLMIFGKLAKHLQKLIKTDKKDLNGFKIFIKDGELRDKIKQVEDEDGKMFERHEGKYIKVNKAELASPKAVKNPELFINFNAYVLGKKDKPAIEEKEITGKSQNHLFKASFSVAHYYYISKDKSEAMFMYVDSLDNYEDEDKKYKNKTGTLIQHVKAKQLLSLKGSLSQRFYVDKNEETKEAFNLNLSSFEFVSISKNNDDNSVNPEDFDNDDEINDDFENSYKTPDIKNNNTDSDMIGEDEIPF